VVALDDPKQAIPPYDAIVLLAPKRAEDEASRTALQPLLATSTSPPCARPTCMPPVATVPARRMQWRAGCGRRSGAVEHTPVILVLREPPIPAQLGNFNASLCGDTECRSSLSLATMLWPGRGGALSPDAVEQNAGRLVVRVLRDQFAPECLSENGGL
jgi:hypothetical protein